MVHLQFIFVEMVIFKRFSFLEKCEEAVLFENKFPPPVVLQK